MRKLLFIFIAACVLESAPRAQTGSPAAATLTVIRAGSLIDGTSDAPRKNQLIFVRGNKIEKVMDASAPIPAGAGVIDLSWATVLHASTRTPFQNAILPRISSAAGLGSA